MRSVYDNASELSTPELPDHRKHAFCPSQAIDAEDLDSQGSALQVRILREVGRYNPQGAARAAGGPGEIPSLLGTLLKYPGMSEIHIDRNRILVSHTWEFRHRGQAQNAH